MAGTIPTVVYYGLGLLSATWFYPATAIVCGARRARHRQLLDDRGDARRGLRRARAADRCRPGDRRRGGHLRRVLRRQDDARLGDDGPRALDGRRRDDQRAHRGDDLDVRAGRRDRARALRDPRPDDPGHRDRASTRRARRRRWPASSRSACSTCCRSSSSSSSRSDASRRSWRSSAARCSPASLASFTQPELVAAFVDEPDQGPVLDRDRGDLRGDGERLRVDDRQRDDRRPVLARRDGRRC